MTESFMDNYRHENSHEKDKPRTFSHFKRLGRELAMQYLFQGDLNIEVADSQEFYRLFWQQASESGVFPDNRVFRKGRVYAEKIIEGVKAKQQVIDELLVKYSEKWDIDRMAVVDRNIMRVAIFEMLCCPDIPPVVSINEALEIAKSFSAEKSSTFINGILNGIKDEIAASSSGLEANS